VLDHPGFKHKFVYFKPNHKDEVNIANLHFDVVGTLYEPLIQEAQLLALETDQRHMEMEAVL
jgi:hypothetical protein